MYSKTKNQLYSVFFSRNNMDTIQRYIQDEVEKYTGVRIDNQDSLDLFNLMQSVYSVNSFNPHGDVSKQIDWMNRIVVRKSVSQIVTGMHMYKQYISDISNPIRPSTLPRYTSTYGNKIPVGSKV